MYCNNCGLLLLDTDRFCRRCGTKIEEIVDGDPDSLKKNIHNEKSGKTAELNMDSNSVQKNESDIKVDDSITGLHLNNLTKNPILASESIPLSEGNSLTKIFTQKIAKTKGCNVKIPYGYTIIDDCAFENRNKLASVAIPNSVISIGIRAFYRCSSLTNITIPDSVTSIGDSAFYECSSLTSITIPDSVTSIGDNAFDLCSNLTNITIPDSVTSIGDKAFGRCSSLTSITIPDSVTSFGENAYYGCTSLKNLKIPNSVTSIGDRAFYGCSSLQSITIPDSVTSIGDWAFYGCSSLTSITIPDSVTSIGDYAFYECSSLTNITIPDSVTSIGEWAFDECTSLTNIIIPDSVTSIGDCAFSDCTSLTSITIPDSVTSIGNCAFSGCSSLTNITIPDSVTSFSDECFGACSSLTSITIPDSVTSIGSSAFNGCVSLQSITIPDSVTSIDYFAFDGCSSLTSITIPDSVTFIGDRAFSGCSSLTNITIPDSGISIGDGNSFLTKIFAQENANEYDACKVEIPYGYKIIGELAFNDCTSLTNIIIPESVVEIGDYAFGGCTSLTNIIIPESVTSIGERAFIKCTSLTSITLPDSVTSIGEDAFSCYSEYIKITCSNGSYAMKYCQINNIETVTILNSTYSKECKEISRNLLEPAISAPFVQNARIHPGCHLTTLPEDTLIDVNSADMTTYRVVYINTGKKSFSKAFPDRKIHNGQWAIALEGEFDDATHRNRFKVYASGLKALFNSNDFCGESDIQDVKRTIIFNSLKHINELAEVTPYEMFCILEIHGQQKFSRFCELMWSDYNLAFSSYSDKIKIHRMIQFSYLPEDSEGSSAGTNRTEYYVIEIPEFNRLVGGEYRVEIVDAAFPAIFEMITNSKFGYQKDLLDDLVSLRLDPDRLIEINLYCLAIAGKINPEIFVKYHDFFSTNFDSLSPTIAEISTIKQLYHGSKGLFDLPSLFHLMYCNPAILESLDLSRADRAFMAVVFEGKSEDEASALYL